MTADLYLTHSVSLKAHPPEDKLAIQNKTVETASVGFFQEYCKDLTEML